MLKTLLLDGYYAEWEFVAVVEVREEQPAVVRSDYSVSGEYNFQNEELRSVRLWNDSTSEREGHRTGGRAG